MTYDSQKYHRRSLRLTGYDYTQAGAYFITACVQDRACLFGEVVGGQMHLNEAGRMVLAEWNSLPVRFPGVELDEFGVMPNHIHGIITIATGGQYPATTGSQPNALPIERTTEFPGPVGATLVVALPVPDPVPVPPTTAAERVAAGPGGATTRVAPTGDANLGGMDWAAVGRQPAASAFERPTELSGPVGATLVVALPDDPVPGPPPPRLGDIVGALKSRTTDLYIHAVKHSGWPPFRGRLWQRNYHEHVIRSERSLNLIRQYILDNPANWASDLEHPEAKRT